MYDKYITYKEINEYSEKNVTKLFKDTIPCKNLYIPHMVEKKQMINILRHFKHPIYFIDYRELAILQSFVKLLNDIAYMLVGCYSCSGAIRVC